MPRDDPEGDMVKLWELATPNQLPSNQWTVLRLDGHCFHTYTRPFDSPHDADLCKAMVQTTIDLCKEFHAITGYTQSDEITLAIPPNQEDPDTKERQPLIFAGRKQKLESLSAGLASARFNHHMQQLAGAIQDKQSRKYAMMTSGKAYFDSRAITVPQPEDVVRIFKWRYTFDCFKNGISALAHHVFSSKELFKKSTRMQMCMLSGAGVDIFGDYPASLFYGTFVKKRLVQKMCENHKTKMMEPCIRSEYAEMSIPSHPMPKNFSDLITCSVLD
jgi:tRNA(His) guanylyltransferase